MLVSFIITARDEDPHILDATLAGLRATAGQFATETLIIDDGSLIPIHPRDGTRVLRNASPLGVSPARRIGAEIAIGEILVWLDAHMSFGPHWLEQMLVQSGTGAFLCSPFWSYDLQECHCWGANFVWNPSRNYDSQKVPGFALAHRVHEPPSGLTVEVPMAVGACYMMRRDAYRRLGGFSPHFRIWGLDEQDMSTRAWIAGCGVRCVTQARVGHLTRNAFPYPVQFEHLEFNQAVMLRSVFEPQTVRRLEQHSQPLPAAVENWLADTDLAGWRETVQRSRRLTDAEFFARFVPELVSLSDAAEQTYSQ